MLLGGVNDSDADARRVRRLIANLNCKVNLIALNPGPEIPYRTPEPERVAAFQEIVRAARSLLRPQTARSGYLRGLRAIEAGSECGSGRDFRSRVSLMLTRIARVCSPPRPDFGDDTTLSFARHKASE